MKKTSAPSITFVVILYNAGKMIHNTLARLTAEIEAAQWSNADILVVDDGSTDDTVAKINAFKKTTSVPIRIHKQKNKGRLTASKVGTELAHGALVSFIGARVLMNKRSLSWLKTQLITHPERKVWNCHIEVLTKGNLQAQFWHVITFVAWRRYLRKPRLISYDIQDFDYYPKGTGAFICTKELLLEGYKHIDSIYDDQKYSSDDTTLIRYIATKERIYMSPLYAADYIARSGVRDFVKHSYDRGTFLLDSYMRPGTRLFVPIILYFVLFLPIILSIILFPVLLLIGLAGCVLVYMSLVIMGVKPRDATGFFLLAPMFGVVYSAGMWKGLVIYFKSRLSRNAS